MSRLILEDQSKLPLRTTEAERVVPDDLLVLSRKGTRERLFYRVDRVERRRQQIVLHLANTSGYKDPVKEIAVLPHAVVAVADLAGRKHVFEDAGLGRAPFRAIGSVEISRALPDGGSQPAGTCDFCGAGIRYALQVRSADGREFVVGLDCAGKVGDAGMRRVALEAEARFAADRRHAKAQEKIGPARRLLEDPRVRAVLAARPHPSPYHAAQGLTLEDYVDHVLRVAGDRGGLEAAHIITKAAKEAGVDAPRRNPSTRRKAAARRR
jgi:hypothetical protein